jgi:hypothetical protein
LVIGEKNFQYQVNISSSWWQLLKKNSPNYCQFIAKNFIKIIIFRPHFRYYGGGEEKRSEEKRREDE